ncbi:PIN domain-containing protein [Micromonospora palythoicola]|uniref:PIN domain-containing protein n=1 Tax=Micromonospora palythoicola TaxID=3120507 RepID=UPI002FCDE78E
MLAISVASLAELQFGVLVAKSAEARALRLARLSAIQRRFDPLPIDEAIADSYARLAARVVETGRQPRARVTDLLIAATAHAHDAAVYTRNAENLTGLEDLITIHRI